MSRSKGKRKILALALTAVIAVSACSGDDDADSATSTSETTESTTSTSESTTTTDPEAELQAEVKAAYEAQWDAYVEIFEDPDPSNPLIEQTYTGETREEILDGVSERLQAGEARRLPDEPSNWVVKVLSVSIADENQATVTACIVNGLVRYERESGRVINDEVVTDIDTAVLRVEDGRWKVANVTFERLEGNPGCADR